jgi:uncharacterized protein (TIGR02145 family)
VTLLDGVYGIVGPVCLDAKGDKPSTQSVAAYNARVDAFASPADYAKTYRFIHNDAYSNLNLMLLDPAGLVESMTSPAPDGTDADKEEPFTLTFKSNIKTRVSFNGDSLTVKLIATYTNNNSFFKVAYLEIRVEDGTCVCPAKIKASPETWLNFMCHNLGGLDIISSSQLITREYQGDWYRFGAKNASMKNIPDNDGRSGSWDNPNYYIPPGNWPADSVPCPAGWRVPTHPEWVNVCDNNTFTNVPATWISTGNQIFGNLKKSGDYLYLPAIGIRNSDDGSLQNHGIYGNYRSSTGSTTFAWALGFGTGTPSMTTSGRGTGMSVRCVQAE